jgi:hypothetical protein
MPAERLDAGRITTKCQRSDSTPAERKRGRCQWSDSTPAEGKIKCQRSYSTPAGKGWAGGQAIRSGSQTRSSWLDSQLSWSSSRRFPGGFVLGVAAALSCCEQSCVVAGL